MTALARHPRLTFLCGGAMILAASWFALHGGAAARRPALVGAAVAFDLTVTASLLAWATLVRAGGAGPLTVVTVFAAGAALAVRWAPAAPRPAVLLLAALGEVAFLSVLALRAVRLTRAWRARGGALPPEDAILQAAREALGRGPVVEALATEAAITWMALGSWRRAPHAPEGARAFTLHRRTGHGAVVVAVLFAGVAETLGLHLLIGRWSDRWAWGATALGLYSLLWLVGDWRAVRLRPALLTPEALEVRVGLRWRVTVPRSRIRQVCVGTGLRGREGSQRLSPLGPANLHLHLSAPVEAIGILGRRRRSDLLGLRVDDPEALAEAIRGG